MIDTLITADYRGSIALGRRGEHNARAVVFDLTWYQEQFPGGFAQVLHQRKGDTAPYLATVTQSASRVTWAVTHDDTAATGTGLAELRWYVGETLCKSVVYATEVMPALGAPESMTPAQKSAIDLLTEAVTGLQVGTNGVSPAVTVSAITGGHRVTIADADHPNGQSFDVMDGSEGRGDMLASVYDPANHVSAAGGIEAYFNAHTTSNPEVTTNKVTSLTSAATNQQYPSAAAVWALFTSITDGNEVRY